MIRFGCSGVSADAILDRELRELEREFKSRVSDGVLDDARARRELRWFVARLEVIGARARARCLH